MSRAMDKKRRVARRKRWFARHNAFGNSEVEQAPDYTNVIRIDERRRLTCVRNTGSIGG
jgi:hypothetical protein